MTKSIRVLVVDDSAFARKVVREVLSTESSIEVVGWARDGIDALERIAELKPDVVTLDLVMPDLDGVGVMDALANAAHKPAIVIVSMTDMQSELGVAALSRGAFDIVQKPTALATERLYDLGDELREKVLAAARRTPRPRAPAASLPPARPSGTPVSTRVVVVGASTGGPQAITTLLSGLPRTFAVPLAIVVHLPEGYTEPFARRLDTESALEVLEARDGLELIAGRAVIARAGMHLCVEARGEKLICRLDFAPFENPHRPAVDVLFETAAQAAGGATLGVVLTGMGADGLEGARAIRAANGRVITETAASCVVYGMPRAVDEAGLSTAHASIEEMAALVVQSL